MAGLTPSIKFPGTHLYSWVDTVRVKCLVQAHRTVSPARARTHTARSGDERANHEATAPTTVVEYTATDCTDRVGFVIGSDLILLLIRLHRGACVVS